MLTAMQSEFHRFVPVAHGRRGSTIPAPSGTAAAMGEQNRSKTLKRFPSRNQAHKASREK